MEYLIALLPPVGLGVLFYVVVRALVRADRIEREETEKLRAQEHQDGNPR